MTSEFDDVLLGWHILSQQTFPIELLPGSTSSYTLRAVAKDTLGNYSTAIGSAFGFFCRGVSNLMRCLLKWLTKPSTLPRQIAGFNRAALLKPTGAPSSQRGFSPESQQLTEGFTNRCGAALVRRQVVVFGDGKKAALLALQFAAQTFPESAPRGWLRPAPNWAGR